MTYRERLVAGLRAKGWLLDLSDRSKYEAFVKPGRSGKLFVGPSGALRSGDCASKSFSVGDPGRQTPIYLAVLKAGELVAV